MVTDLKKKVSWTANKIAPAKGILMGSICVESNASSINYTCTGSPKIIHAK
jgi:hypothetical protein